MKWKGFVSTGGEAKQIILSGVISVNGLLERKRGRKLLPGDVVRFDEEDYIVPQ